MSKLAKKQALVKHVFRQDSKDFKFLLNEFKKGRIKPSDKPASVRKQYGDRYEKYTTGQFRSQFNKAKAIAGGNFSKFSCHYLLHLHAITHTLLQLSKKETRKRMMKMTTRKKNLEMRRKLRWSTKSPPRWQSPRFQPLAVRITHQRPPTNWLGFPKHSRNSGKMGKESGTTR